MCGVSCFLKISILKNKVVIGFKVFRIVVGVELMQCMVFVMVINEIIVGKIVSEIVFIYNKGVGIGCSFVQNFNCII